MKAPKKQYIVIVGNIGTVYDGADIFEALRVYRAYMNQSDAGYGRAAAETVTLFGDGEPLHEFVPGELNE